MEKGTPFEQPTNERRTTLDWAREEEEALREGRGGYADVLARLFPGITRHAIWSTEKQMVNMQMQQMQEHGEWRHSDIKQDLNALRNTESNPDKGV